MPDNNNTPSNTKKQKAANVSPEEHVLLQKCKNSDLQVLEKELAQGLLDHLVDKISTLPPGERPSECLQNFALAILEKCTLLAEDSNKNSEARVQLNYLDKRGHRRSKALVVAKRARSTNPDSNFRSKQNFVRAKIDDLIAALGSDSNLHKLALQQFANRMNHVVLKGDDMKLRPEEVVAVRD